jgi:hypothetical protein
MHSGAPAVVAALQAPHKLLAVEFGTNEVLGYSEQLLRGSTFQIFHGYRTDSTRINAAIKAASFGATTNLQLDLYHHSGNYSTLSTSFEPFCDIRGCPVGCKVSFSASPVIDIDEALADESCAKILTSADPSQRINYACRKIISILGTSSNQLLIKTISDLATTPTHLSNLVHSAAAGRIHQDIVRMRNTSLTDIACHVTCIPVVPCYGAQISHVLLLVNTDCHSEILPDAPPSPSDEPAVQTSIEASYYHCAILDVSTAHGSLAQQRAALAVFPRVGTAGQTANKAGWADQPQ